MAGNNAAVFGIYTTHASLKIGVQKLKDSGFRRSDISVLFPIALEQERDDPGKIRKAGELAPADTTTDTGVAGVMAELETVSTLWLPGLGHLIIAGPIAAILLGSDGGVEGLAGRLTSLGVPERQAKSYQERLKQGAMLISVQPDNGYWRRRALEIMARTGALEIFPGEPGSDVFVIHNPSPTSP